MNNPPDWAEFVFKVGDSVYYGGKDQFCGKGGEPQHWRPTTMRSWREDPSAQPIIRQLEND